VTNSASDPDDLGSAGASPSLSFTLDPGAPSGMTIDATSGLIEWTPTEAQGPGTYAVSVRVTDDGDPPQSDSETLTVFVVEVNTPPELAVLSDQLVNIGDTVAFTASATDSDFPAQGLAFALGAGAPPAASIEGTSGLFSWIPGLADAGTTNNINITVSDFGSPPLAASRSFVIIVMAELRASVSRTGDTVLISVPSIPGRTYRLEHKDALEDPSWEPLGSEAVAGGATLTFSDDTGNNAQRFYRVILVE